MRRAAPLARKFRDQQFLLAAFVAAGLAVYFVPSLAREPFARILGSLPALIALAICLPAGLLALVALHRNGWPVPHVQGTAARPRIATLFLLGALWSLPMVLLDIARPFPAEINVPPPPALLFYPVIALLAEVVFHLCPLALLVTIFRSSDRSALALLLTAAVEPAYQSFLVAGAPETVLLMALLIYGFSLLQLEMFRRRGVLALIAMRLGYYLIWHILWGTVRLDLLAGRFP